MKREEVLEQLCVYDLRNPDYISPYDDDYREPRGNCKCDNCFYGRDKLAVALIDLMDKADHPTEEKTVKATTKSKKPKNGVKVYLIINTENQPGRVLAVMADEEGANRFADDYEALGERCEVEERTLFYGQPSNCGYNK